MDNELNFFKGYQETKTYISKLFTWGGKDLEGKRNVNIVMDGSNDVRIGEIEGALCLRLTGKKRRTQVTAIVTQDHLKVRKLTLQTFKDYGGDAIFGQEKEAFTFRDDEFQRLVRFLEQIQFLNLNNTKKFQIEDISTGDGAKIVVDVDHKKLIEHVGDFSTVERDTLLAKIRTSLTKDEINTLLGRREGLTEFSSQLEANDWSEKRWQEFFDEQDWVFGYGLDYRISQSFDREMTVGIGGADNQDRPVVDFLRAFTEYSVLVEIKKPETAIFKKRRGRAGTMAFAAEFIEAVSQVYEQKAEWLATSSTAQHFSHDGHRRLEARTRNPKAILVIGSQLEFEAIDNDRDRNVALDTFELFRRAQNGIDIITFDELYNRAKFIVES